METKEDQAGTTTSATAFGHSFLIHGKNPQEYIFRTIASTGTLYEAGLLRTLSYLPLGEGAIVDAGANLGNHTLFFAKVLQRRVVAVEPYAGNLALLRANVSDNGVADLVDVHAGALGATEGRTSLGQRIAGNSGTYFTDGEGDIAVSRLDVIVQEPVALLKVDTEGDEVAVLRGAAETLRRDRPFLCVEAHDGKAYRAIAEVIEPLGYAPLEVAGLSDNFLFGSPSAVGPARFESLARLLQLRAARQNHRDLLGQLATIQRQLAGLTAGSDELRQRVDELEQRRQ